MAIRVAKVAPELEEASSPSSPPISSRRPPPRLPPLARLPPLPARGAAPAAADDDFPPAYKGNRPSDMTTTSQPSLDHGRDQEGNDDGRARKEMVVVEATSSSPPLSSPELSPPPSPLPESSAPATPNNYAYDASGSGYEGLLLHRLWPRLAEWAFPFLATSTADLFAFMIMSLASSVSCLPLLLPTLFPGILTQASLLIFVPVLHRACFTDLNIMPLLLHQFDTWFLLCNNAIMGACGFTSMFSPGARFCVEVLNLGSLITLVLDAIRAPLRSNMTYLLLAGSCAGVSFMWAGLHMLELGPPQVFDYNAVLVGRTTVASVFTGRMATQGFFFLRYTFKLWWHPDAHVVLTRPVKTPTSVRRSPYATTSKVQPQVDGASTPPTSEKLLLDALLPHTWPVEHIYGCLVHRWTDHLVLACLVVGVGLPLGCSLLPTVFAPRLAYSSLLLSIHGLHRLFLAEPRLFRPILSNFDTLWLLANVSLALACLSPATGLVHQWVDVRVSHVTLLLSFITAIGVDATRLPARSKLLSLGVHAAALLGTVLLLTLGRLSHLDFEATVLNGSTNVSSFYAARMLMLGIYGARYMFKLWLRPDCYVVIHKPMLRAERGKILASTLRIQSSVRGRALQSAIEEQSEEEKGKGSGGAATGNGGNPPRVDENMHANEKADGTSSSSNLSDRVKVTEVVSDYPATSNRTEDRHDTGPGLA